MTHNAKVNSRKECREALTSLLPQLQAASGSSETKVPIVTADGTEPGLGAGRFGKDGLLPCM